MDYRTHRFVSCGLFRIDMSALLECAGIGVGS
jgi:hypothetical protein